MQYPKEKCDSLQNALKKRLSALGKDVQHCFLARQATHWILPVQNQQTDPKPQTHKDGNLTVPGIRIQPLAAQPPQHSLPRPSLPRAVESECTAPGSLAALCLHAQRVKYCHLLL